MTYKTQDPKYGIKDNQIVNMATGEPIPLDEPIMIFRGKDLKSIIAINAYSHSCMNAHHRRIVRERLQDFIDWQGHNHSKVKEPDTAKVG